MNAQDTMRLMFDTMDAYDRSDFERLGEIYAEEAVWKNSDLPDRTARIERTSSTCSAAACPKCTSASRGRARSARSSGTLSADGEGLTETTGTARGLRDCPPSVRTAVACCMT